MKSTLLVSFVLFASVIINSQSLNYKDDTPDRTPAFENLNDNSGSGYADAVALNNQGINLALAKKYDEASKLFRQVVGAVPLSPEAHYNLGLSLLKSGHESEGIEFLNHSISIQPDHLRPHIVLGEAFYQRGELDKSIVELRRAGELDPKDPVTFNDIAVALTAVNDYKQAMEAVETAIKLKPDFANAYNNRGMIYYNTKKYKESIVSFRQAIALDPALAAAHNNLGTALAMTGKVKDSLKCYIEAIRLKPDWDYALYNVAVSYLKLG